MMTNEELKKWSRENWNKIPADQRKRCLEHLDGWLPNEVLKKWKTEGFPDDFHFSFGGGMTIRNRLRDIMKDEKLPPVEYSDGHSFSNWDDYYQGALDELMEQIDNKRPWWF